MATQNTEPRLVLVTGLPCTGKSTLSRRLAADLRLPLVGKDEIKELLFDGLGYEDRAWSIKLGGMSFELLYWSIIKILSAGSSLIEAMDLPGDVLTVETTEFATVDYDSIRAWLEKQLADAPRY